MIVISNAAQKLDRSLTRTEGGTEHLFFTKEVDILSFPSILTHIHIWIANGHSINQMPFFIAGACVKLREIGGSHETLFKNS